MDTITTKIKRTRKPHICEFCARMIEPGESAEKGFYAEGGDAYSYYLCAWCSDNIGAVLDGEPEWSPGELHEHVGDALCGQKCPVCNSGDYDIDVDTKLGMVTLECCDYVGGDNSVDLCENKWEIGLDVLLGLGSYAK